MNEKLRIKHSLIFPILFLILIWLIKLYEYSLNLNFVYFGIYPVKISGLIGILTSPLIHGDFKHIISNSFPIFILSTGLFYFYRKFAYQIFFLIYFVSGTFVWIFAREAYHIGASGIVYGLASFIFFSGIFSKKREMMAISLAVIFVYGSMIWGIFPGLPNVSWEAHLFGFLVGIALSIIYLNKIETSDKPKDEPKIREDFYDFQEISTTYDIDFEYFFYNNDENK